MPLVFASVSLQASVSPGMEVAISRKSRYREVSGVGSRDLDIFKWKLSEMETSSINRMLASKKCTLVEISELWLRTKVGNRLKPRLTIYTSTGGCIRVIL